MAEPGGSVASESALSNAIGKHDAAPNRWALLDSHAALRKCLGFLSLAQVCASRRIHSVFRRCADETLEDRLFLQTCATAGFAASERFDCWYDARLDAQLFDFVICSALVSYRRCFFLLGVRRFLTSSASIARMHSRRYESLCDDIDSQPASFSHPIAQDIRRTFPDHVFFAGPTNGCVIAATFSSSV
jgi:hypothetical protein